MKRDRSVLVVATSLAAVLFPLLVRGAGAAPFTLRAADVPTTTVLDDDFLTLFPSDSPGQDDYVAGDDDVTDPSVDLPGTGAHAVTWGSAAFALVAAGAIVTANARSRRPRPPRSGARSGPAA